MEMCGHLYSQDSVTFAHWVGGWVGTRADLDVVMLGKVYAPAGKCTPIHLVCSLVY